MFYRSVQNRISYDLLISLSNALMNDTIFEIVKGLMDLQHVTERFLEQEAIKIASECELEIEEWNQKFANIEDQEELTLIKNLMKIKHEKIIRESRIKTILDLDEKVRDQQQTLECANIPGFYITENPKEIAIQMHLLNLILRLSKLNFQQDSR